MVMEAVLSMSKAATPLILAIILLRALCVHRLPKRTFPVLWGVAAARLMLPVAVPFRWNLTALVRLLDAWLAKLSAAPVQAQGTAEALEPALAPTSALLSTAPPPTATASPLSGLVWVWLAVSALCAAYFAATYIISQRRFAASLPVHDASVDAWCRAHPLRRRVAVRYSDQVASPLTYGILRPVILLPKAALRLPYERLACVLLHEHTHIRRLDALTKLLLVATLCVHWFNPLVWALFILAGRDMELACDEAVVQALGHTMKAAYASALLDMEETKHAVPTPLFSSFSKYAIEERIQSIMKMKHNSILATLLALVLVIGMTVVFATSASAGEETLPSAANLTLAGDASAISFYTYDEYKAWLDGERAALQGLVGTGAKGWTSSRGVFEWTQAVVDETIAMYEAILEDIRAGALVSKPIGDGDVMISSAADVTVAMDAVPAALIQSQASADLTGAVQVTMTEAAQLTPPQGNVIASSVLQDTSATLHVFADGMEPVAAGELGQTVTYSAVTNEATAAMGGVAGFSEVTITSSTQAGTPAAEVIPAIAGVAHPAHTLSEGSMQAYSAAIDLGDRITAQFGPFETVEALNAAVDAYCQAQVQAGLMTAEQMAKIMADMAR